MSHDRYFINRVADHLLVAEPGRFRVIEGNYDTYLHLVRAGLAAAPAESARIASEGRQEKAPRSDRRAEPDAEPPKRKRRFPYRKVEDLEAEILDRETRVEELHAMLALPETHRDGDCARQVKTEIAEVQHRLETLYAHWEEAMELNW